MAASISARPPRGGLCEDFGGEKRFLLLTLGDIERFEDSHRGLLALQEDMHLPGRAPKMGVIADLLSLALSRELKPPEMQERFLSLEAAGAVVRGPLPEDARRQLAIARALVGVTFEPDLYDRIEADGDVADDDAAPEKAGGNGSTSGG